MCEQPKPPYWENLDGFPLPFIVALLIREGGNLGIAHESAMHPDDIARPLEALCALETHLLWKLGMRCLRRGDVRIFEEHDDGITVLFVTTANLHEAKEAAEARIAKARAAYEALLITPFPLSIGEVEVSLQPHFLRSQVHYVFACGFTADESVVREQAVDQFAGESLAQVVPQPQGRRCQAARCVSLYFNLDLFLFNFCCFLSRELKIDIGRR
jgi:hypothetical protein